MTATPNDTFSHDLSPDRLLPWPEVRALAGISRTTAWRLQNAGEFPRPVVLSPGRVGWRESDVAAWRAALAPRGPAQSGRPRRFEPPAEPTQPVAAAATLRLADPTPPPPRQRRRPSTHPGQLSFDF